MDSTLFTAYTIDDRSYLSFIKRELHNLLTQEGFKPQRVGEIDIVVSELTSNLIKHADGGEMLYHLGTDGDNKYLDLFTIDSGPGHADIQRMIRDGASSANTLGHGLGAIGRLSHGFQIYSQRAWGTVAHARCYIADLPLYVKTKSALNSALIQVAMPGERVCGDGYMTKLVGDDLQIFMGDGLGHGPNAYEAVQTAIEAFLQCGEKQPVDILREIHQKVKKTRGLVGTVVIYNAKANEWRICGIGNITTRLFEGLISKNYMSHNGIIGHNIPTTMNNYVVTNESYQALIMYSDGMRTRWDMPKYPSLLKYSPAIIAGTIYKDNARKTDDMSVMVAKINQ